MDCFPWVNTLLGNFKSPIQGSYHDFRFDKYAARYLADVQYPFDLPRMISRLLRADDGPAGEAVAPTLVMGLSAN